MTPGRWVALVVVLIVALLGTMFTVQNLSRTTDLSLNLWLWAWHLENPLPIPALLWGTFGGGFLMGGMWSILGRMSSGRRIRDLEAQVAQASFGTNVDDDWA